MLPRDNFRMVPSLKAHLRSIHAILALWEHGSWNWPLHMGSQVLKFKYDTDAYIATFFGGEARDLYWELANVFFLKKQKNSTQLTTQDPQHLHKIIKSLLLTNTNHNLMVLEAQKLDLASILGLVESTRMVFGTWDPMSTNPYLFWGVC